MKTLLLAMIMLITVAYPSFGQRTLPQPAAAIDTLINTDGTLKTNSRYQGSLDFKGFKMVIGKDGRPHFVRAREQKESYLSDPTRYLPARDSTYRKRFMSRAKLSRETYNRSPKRVMTVPEDSLWDCQFVYGGLDGGHDDGEVIALAVIGNNLYVGGSFETAGGVAANNIAKWDGTKWSPLESGVYGAGYYDCVWALAVIGNDLYVGGDFTYAGSIEASGIAKWDGNSWSGVGGGVPGPVSAMTVSGNDLYVAGAFPVSSWPRHNIEKWDGTQWSIVGTETNFGNLDFLTAIAVSGNNVYVGGFFPAAGGVAAKNIAKWNGTSWSALGGGLYLSGVDLCDVWAITASGDTVYAGGDFTLAGGTTVNHVARWDGSKWSALKNGVDGSVFSIAVAGNNLYVGGSFINASGLSANFVAEWDGTSWSALGEGTNYVAEAVLVNGNDVYAGGNFTAAGDVATKCVAKWDGSEWTGMVNAGEIGLSDNAYSMAVSGNNVYVGGVFRGAGDLLVNSIARWDGSRWSSLDGGLTRAWVYALGTSGNDLYAGGAFDGKSGGVKANSIAKWDGSNWTSLGSGVMLGDKLGIILGMAVKGSDVYVGGIFDQAGSVSVKSIARWDGSNWYSMGDCGAGEVWALAVSPDGTVYAGGYLTGNLAQWDGTSWTPVGGGIGDNGVYALAFKGNDLYVGGDFYMAGSVSVNNIAKWDGSHWSDPGGGTNGIVWAITVSGNDVYVGGSFSSAGDVSANGIAKWDGTRWSTFGSGTGTVQAVGVVGSDVCVGGSFTSAGGKQSWNFARWHPCPTFSVQRSSVNVGNVLVGVARCDSVTISNPGTAVLNIDSVYSDNPEFTVTPANGAVDTARSRKFYITFTPRSMGTKSGNIIFRHNASSSPALLPDSGVGLVSAPWVSTQALSYRDVAPGSSQQDSVTISNYGNYPLTVDSVTSTDPEFAASPARVVIAPLDSQKFYVTFTPTTDSAKIGEVTFWHDGPESPAYVTVSNGELVFYGQTYQHKWNLISVPLTVGDYRKTRLFPTACSNAYSFSGTYTLKDTLWNGTGYWVKFGSSQTVTIIGLSRSSDTVEVSRGWNLIGTVSGDVLTSSIAAIGTTLQSQFYGYRDRYETTDTLRAGQGYWIKAGSGGRLALSSALSVLKTRSVQSPRHILERLTSIVFEDASGASQTLYVSEPHEGLDASQGWDLPPVPPAGIFDVRFGSGRMLEVTAENHQEEFPIILSSAEYPLTIRWDMKQSDRAAMLTVDGKAILLRSSGSAQVSHPTSQIQLVLSPKSHSEAPTQFALEQNYPNPFNPQTAISYQLPVGNWVTLKVYNMLGQEVAVLVSEFQTAGYKSTTLDASNLSSGIYVYRIIAGGFRDVRKMIVIK